MQCHLYSDFLGGPGVEMSAIFLLATRRNMSKIHALLNRKEFIISVLMACNRALWLTDSVLRFQIFKGIKWPNAFKSKGFSFAFCFLGPHPWHMEVPRLGVKSEL